MNVKEIKSNNKGFYYYQTDIFSKIIIEFRFSIKSSKENYIKAIILSEYLNQTNAKYKSLKEINNKCRELYGLSYYTYFGNIGIQDFLYFSCNIKDPKIIGEDYFNDSIDFIHSILFKPNFKNGTLDLDIYNLIIKSLINDSEDTSKNPARMQYNLFLKNAIPSSQSVLTRIHDINDLKNVLSNIKPKDIINFYDEIMQNYNCGYAFGNLSNENIEYLTKAFPFVNKKFDNCYTFKETITNGVKDIVSKDTSQSYLYVVYDINNYDYQDKNYIYSVIVDILNNNGDGIILNVLRKELGIVYSAYATVYNMRGFMYIYAEIDKKNKDRCLKGIDDIFSKLHDSKIIEPILNQIKIQAKENIYTAPENIGYYLNAIRRFISHDDLLEDEIAELIQKLTVEDVLKEINNLEKKFIFFYKGDKE